MKINLTSTFLRATDNILVPGVSEIWVDRPTWDLVCSRRKLFPEAEVLWWHWKCVSANGANTIINTVSLCNKHSRVPQASGCHRHRLWNCFFHVVVKWSRGEKIMSTTCDATPNNFEQPWFCVLLPQHLHVFFSSERDKLINPSWPDEHRRCTCHRRPSRCRLLPPASGRRRTPRPRRTRYPGLPLSRWPAASSPHTHSPAPPEHTPSSARPALVRLVVKKENLIRVFSFFCVPNHLRVHFCRCFLFCCTQSHFIWL